MADIEIDSSPRWDASSHYAREARKWNTPRSQGGMRPDGYEPYPAMMYRARKRVDARTGEPYGPFVIIDPYDERFSESNCLTVRDERERDRAHREGWRDTPEAAMAYATGEEYKVAIAAAERHEAERNMSPAAQAEAAAVDAKTSHHVPEIPEAPKRRQGAA